MSAPLFATYFIKITTCRSSISLFSTKSPSQWQSYPRFILGNKTFPTILVWGPKHQHEWILKLSSYLKGKNFNTPSPPPLSDMALFGGGYRILTGTHSHSCSNCLGDQKRKFFSSPPSPQSSGTRDRSQKAMGALAICNSHLRRRHPAEKP